jgi:hypothetical protein
MGAILLLLGCEFPVVFGSDRGQIMFAAAWISRSIRCPLKGYIIGVSIERGWDGVGLP